MVTSRILTFAIIASMYMYVQIVIVTRHGQHFNVHAISDGRPAPFCVCLDMAFYSSCARSNVIRTPNQNTIGWYRFGDRKLFLAGERNGKIPTRVTSHVYLCVRSQDSEAELLNVSRKHIKNSRLALYTPTVENSVNGKMLTMSTVSCAPCTNSGSTSQTW